MIPPDDDMDVDSGQNEIEALLQQSVDSETYQAMVQDDKQSILQRTESLPLENVETDSLRVGSPKRSKTTIPEPKTSASSEKPADSKPRIYVREEFKLKSNDINPVDVAGKKSNVDGVSSQNKSADALLDERLHSMRPRARAFRQDSKCTKNSEFRPSILCIHCKMSIDVQMDCILNHCLSCETIVKDDDPNSRECKYLCFACKVYVFDNTCGQTHIKKHISTHLKRMNLYEPGNTWY